MTDAKDEDIERKLRDLAEIRTHGHDGCQSSGGCAHCLSLRDLLRDVYALAQQAPAASGVPTGAAPQQEQLFLDVMHIMDESGGCEKHQVDFWCWWNPQEGPPCASCVDLKRRIMALAAHETAIAPPAVEGPK